jgi:predicted amidohydrolase
MQSPTVRVAITQLEPEWLDLQRSVDKVCRYIAEAAQNGAKLVTFPECFVPGYPAWIWYELFLF